METEPGPVNNEIKQDYRPTNNTPSSPILCWQSLCIREPAKEMSPCAWDSLGGPLGKSEEYLELARWRKRVDTPGREQSVLGWVRQEAIWGVRFKKALTLRVIQEQGRHLHIPESECFLK